MLSLLRFSVPRHYFCTHHFITSLVSPKFKISYYCLFRARQWVNVKLLVLFPHTLTFEHPVYIKLQIFLGQEVKTKMIILCIHLYCLQGAKFYNTLRRTEIHYNFRSVRFLNIN